jgi:hypothetical protein
MFSPRRDPRRDRRETNEGSHDAMSRMYAPQANDMAGNARVRAFQPCPVSPAVDLWSTLVIGTTTGRKHGRPRRPEVSHQ